MPYKTENGTHYHLKYGCRGATIICGTEGLEPCSFCTGVTTDKTTGKQMQYDKDGVCVGEYRNPGITLKDEVDRIIGVFTAGTAATASDQDRQDLNQLLERDLSINGNAPDMSEAEDVLLRVQEMIGDDGLALGDHHHAPVIPDAEPLANELKEFITHQFAWQYTWRSQKAPNIPTPQKNFKKGINNETAGISVEVALAEIFDVDVDGRYASRANRNMASRVQDAIQDAFSQTNCLPPAKHTAEKGNPVDFALAGTNPETGKPYTLSVKSNMDRLGKQAGQRLGQMGSDKTKEFFETTLDYGSFPGGSPHTPEYAQSMDLIRGYLRDKDKQREILTAELEALFECDALLAVSHVRDGEPQAILIGQYSDFQLDPSKITFANDREQLDDWRSVTVHYAGVSIAEIQMHESRNTLFKCRFDLGRLIPLLGKNGKDGVIPATYKELPKQQ